MGKSSRIRNERRDARQNVHLTRAQSKALNDEIQRQIYDISEEFYKTQVYIILYCIHHIYGFGPKRLKRFFMKYTETQAALRDYYGFSKEEGIKTDIVSFLARREMVAYGVDVDKWMEEKYGKKGESFVVD